MPFLNGCPVFRLQYQSVNGIGNTSVQAIISVIGVDMSCFPTDKQISFLARLCPGDYESARKRKSGRTRKGNTSYGQRLSWTHMHL